MAAPKIPARISLHAVRPEFLITITRGHPAFKAILGTIRALPVRVWDEEARNWRVPYEYATALHVAAQKHSMHIPRDVQEMMVKYMAITQEAEKQHLGQTELEAGDDIFVPNLKKVLREYQKVAVKFGAEKRRYILGDQMRLGKTISAIATVAYTNTFPCLVVCGVSHLSHWRREFLEWMDLRLAIMHNVKAMESHARHYHVMVINYEQLYKMEKIFPFIRAVIIDEAHQVKNYDAEKTKAALKLCAMPNVETVQLLTGTPIMNSAADLMPLLEMCNALRFFGGKDTYRKRYVSNPANNILLSEKIREYCFLRRETHQVVKQVPTITREIINFELDTTDLHQYEEMRDKLEQNVLDYQMSRQNMTEAERKMKAEETREKSKEIRKMLEKMREAVALAKIGKVAVFIAELIAQGEKVIIFCHHQSVMKEMLRVCSKFTKCVHIDGGSSVEARNFAIHSFQRDPNYKVIACSIRAASTGITLTAAKTVIMHELDYVPGINDQAESRPIDIMDPAPVIAYYPMAVGTYDQRIYEIVEQKRTTMNQITRGTSEDLNKTNIAGFSLVETATDTLLLVEIAERKRAQLSALTNRSQ